MNRILKPALVLLALLLTACSGVMDSAQPSKQYYLLSPVDGGGAAAAEGAPSLTLSVRAVPGLDTDRIQALGSDASLDRYANARWPDHLPEVLGSVMKRSLAASGQFSSVNEGTRGGGWLLTLEVQKFYGLRSGGATSNVVVEMSGSIHCGDRSGQFTLSSSNPVGEERLASVVSAHQRGLNDVTLQLLERIDGACS